MRKQFVFGTIIFVSYDFTTLRNFLARICTVCLLTSKTDSNGISVRNPRPYNFNANIEKAPPWFVFCTITFISYMKNRRKIGLR